MRVLFFSKAKRTTQATEHMMAALRRHCQVAIALHINYRNLERFMGKRWANRLICARIRRFRPDLTLVNNQDIRSYWLKLCRDYGTTACVYHEYLHDMPVAPFDIGRQVDFLYIASEKQIQAFKKMGALRVRMLLRGCSLDNHYPIDKAVRSKWRSDVAFIGKPRIGIRQQIIEAVSRHCELKLWGDGWSRAGLRSRQRRVHAQDYRKICAGSKIMLGINDCGAETMEKAISLAKCTSNRTRTTLACGGFLLTNYNKGLEEIFKPGVHLDFYSSIEECLVKIDYYLTHPDERARIAEDGSAHVRANMTFDHFVDEVVRDARSLRTGGTSC